MLHKRGLLSRKGLLPGHHDHLQTGAFSVGRENFTHLLCQLFGWQHRQGPDFTHHPL
uniref:Uncharacterized protein n=1 Tax=Anguilla anguilla TaxID=7936 RepID=A0A0E9QHD9_ANGAN